MTSFDETLSLELRTRPLPVTHVQVGNCRSYGRSRHVKPRVTRQKQTLPSTTLPIYVRRTATRVARAGTTSVACTAAWATARRWNSSRNTKKHKVHRGAGCPPPGSVVVVISDPPPARGQPARQHQMEDTFRCKTQLQICPSKRVNLTSGSSFARHRNAASRRSRGGERDTLCPSQTRTAASGRDRSNRAV